MLDAWNSVEKSVHRDRQFLLAMLLDPRQMVNFSGNILMTSEFHAGPEAFFSADCNAYIFGCMEELWVQSGQFDLISLAERINENGMLEWIGGAEYLAGLTEQTV